MWSRSSPGTSAVGTRHHNPQNHPPRPGQGAPSSLPAASTTMRQTSWSSAARDRGASGASAISMDAPGVLERTCCQASSRFRICGRTSTAAFTPWSISAPAAM
eukprot:3654309-Pleurochrysis_carterae.AAC.1